MKQIAIAGKGGTGKTTFSAMLIRNLLQNRLGKSILAVDGDPNANLNEALGMTLEETISTILEDTKKPNAVPTGMTKDLFVEYMLQGALVETEDIDLLVMGNPQGSGCYCYPNDLLRKHLEKLRANYDYVVVDNEAGLEHLSRRIISDVDTMIVISDATARGIRSAGRICEIVQAVKLDVRELYLVITKVSGNEVDELQGEIEKTGLKLLGYVPYDPLVAEFDLKGKALTDLPGDSVSVRAVDSIIGKLNL